MTKVQINTLRTSVLKDSVINAKSKSEDVMEVVRRLLG